MKKNKYFIYLFIIIIAFFIINKNVYAYKVNCTSTNTNNTSYIKYYGANWDYWPDAAYYGGDEMYTWISNEFAMIIFTRTGIDLIATRANVYDVQTTYLDKSPAFITADSMNTSNDGTADLWDVSGGINQQIIPLFNNLAYGTHTVAIKHDGPFAGGGNYIELEGWVVRDDVVPITNKTFASSDINILSVNVPILSFNIVDIDAQIDANHTIKSLKITNLGTMQDTTDISSVKLYYDVNGDYNYDGGDSLIGAGTFAGGKWEFTGLTIKSETNLIVTMDAEPGSVNSGRTFQAAILPGDITCISNKVSSVSITNKGIYTLIGPPLASAILSISAVSSNQIDLVWENVANETSYTLFKNTANSTTVGISSVIGKTVNDTNHNDATLITNTTYYYWLKAYNVYGASPYSTVGSDTTWPGKPAAPAILSTDPSAIGQIDVVWENVANESSYTLFRDLDNNSAGATKIGIPGGADTTNYNNIGLADLTLYYYWVKAYNMSGGSPYSAYASNTTMSNPLPQPPSAPTILSITAISTNQINLVWQVSANTASNILFRREIVDNIVGASNIFRSPADNTNYIDTGLSPDTIYYYWIIAWNINGSTTNTASKKTGKTVSPSIKVYGVFPTVFKPLGGLTARIHFGGETPDLDITIYDTAGNIVKTYIGVSGVESVPWDGKNDRGDELKTGMYIVFIKLKDGEEHKIKMVINR